jgi:hypothetical protein
VNASALSARPTDADRREPRDRLELLTALINGPGFDPVFRDDVIRIPPGHRIYPWLRPDQMTPVRAAVPFLRWLALKRAFF